MLSFLQASCRPAGPVFPVAQSVPADSSGLAVHLAAMLPKDSIWPVWGYRFVIRGDFDGDGRREVLTEHFYSNRDGAETNKYDSGTDFFAWFDSAYKKEAVSFMLCSNKALDTVPVGGVTGPLVVRNEGDLDGDGGDELSAVPSLPQASSINHCTIFTYKKGAWHELYSFEMREWMLPQLPQGGKMYFIGANGTYVTGQDSLDAILEKELKTAKGFLQPLRRRGRYKIETLSPDTAEDTVLYVDFKKLKYDPQKAGRPY